MTMYDNVKLGKDQVSYVVVNVYVIVCMVIMPLHLQITMMLLKNVSIQKVMLVQVYCLVI